MARASLPIKQPVASAFKKGLAKAAGGDIDELGRSRTKRICDELGFNWQRYAIDRILDTKLPHSSRDYALGLIADRCDPKLKANEITNAQQEALTQVLINIVSGEPNKPDEPLQPIGSIEVVSNES